VSAVTSLDKLREALDNLDDMYQGEAESRTALDELAKELDTFKSAHHHLTQLHESALSQLSAQPKALEWVAGGEGATDGDRELLVLDMGNGHTAFALARWEDHRQRWLDDKTDGQNDRLEWYPGQILWRAPIAVLVASLPPKG
jgi:hypothetical protein